MVGDHLVELDLKDKKKEKTILLKNNKRYAINSFDVHKDEKHICITTENSEIFIYKKDEKSQNIKEINRVSIHMK